MNRMPVLTSAAITTLSLAPLSGCAPAGEEAVAEAVVTSALQTNEGSGIGKDVVETLDDACIDDPELAAAEVASRPSVAFIPSSCVEKTADGNTVHAELDGCSGRFGRSTVDGGLDAIIESIGECRLRADVVDSGDLVANGKPLLYDATAFVRLLPDDVRNVDWEGHFDGTTPRGRSIEQWSHLDILARRSDNCVSVDGVAEGHVDHIDYDLTLDGLAVCPDECPSAGVVQAHAQGRRREGTLTVEFDGSTTAHVIGWTGREFDVEMVCRPASR